MVFLGMQRALFPLHLSSFPLFLGLAGVLLLVTSAARAQDVRGFDTVIIDAGHGGHDRGGVPGQRGIAEKTATLDTAFRLQRILRARGLRVIMTRTSDDFIPLGARTGATYRQDRRRTVFLSIHFNSAPREGARGIETYYYRGDSFGLASRLHQSLVANMGTDDRSLRRRPFYVIRRSDVPAVLCECGFLTNGEEESRIAGTTYRQRLAESLASGLLAQRGAGNVADLGNQPRVSTERLYPGARGGGRSSRGRHSYASSRHYRGSARHHGSSRHRHSVSSGRRHGKSSASHRSSGRRHHRHR